MGGCAGVGGGGEGGREGEALLLSTYPHFGGFSFFLSTEELQFVFCIRKLSFFLYFIPSLFLFSFFFSSLFFSLFFSFFRFLSEVTLYV